MSESIKLGADEKFCSSCGGVVKKEAEICMKCGVRLGGGKGDKSWGITLLLCLFLGCIGGHRFYTGNTGIAVVQLLTLGGLGIWTFIDFIMILAGSYKDGNGKPLRK